MMEERTTREIRVSVRSTYQPTYSKPTEDRYVFSYHVVIENLGASTVRLLYRHWIITNALGGVQEVEGEGVIGRQPILEPGAGHSYDSWCPLPSPLGSMEGRYLMVDLETGEEFYVEVPRFHLAATVVLN